MFWSPVEGTVKNGTRHPYHLPDHVVVHCGRGSDGRTYRLRPLDSWRNRTEGASIPDLSFIQGGPSRGYVCAETFNSLHNVDYTYQGLYRSQGRGCTFQINNTAVVTGGPGV